MLEHLFRIAARACIAYTTALNIQPADAYGAPTNTAVPVLVYLADYPGWRGNAYNYIASVTVQPNLGPTSNRPARACPSTCAR